MKYVNITDLDSAVDLFNESTKNFNGEPYRVIELKNNQLVMSNVPASIYNNQASKKYCPPKPKKRDKSEQIIPFLHEAFNFFHNNSPHIIEKHADGKLFHYNHCFDNSMAVYYCLQNLVTSSDLPISEPISICIGYISRPIKHGTAAGSAVLNIPNLIVHDWHLWNKVNGFIIDLSIRKQGNPHCLQTEKLQWIQAQDHVFKKTPKNLTYHGVDFSDPTKFHEYSEEIFGIS